MAVLEELPDEASQNDGCENQRSGRAPAPSADKPATLESAPMGPALPAAIASVRNTTVDEFVRQLNKMPLFMTELDETGEDDCGENTVLEAIRALQLEGGPGEAARNFKEAGNERFRLRNYTDAREFYSRALTAATGHDDCVAVTLACLNNRAQCNLQLRNFRQCIIDCRAAIQLAGGSSGGGSGGDSDKAWFRAAKALLALDKVDEAAACIENAQRLSPTHSQVAALAGAIETRRAQLQRQDTARRERERTLKRAADALAIALRARSISTRATAAPPELPDDIRIRFEADDCRPDRQLLFPVLLVYPLHLRTDVIAAAPETSTVGEQLAHVLAEPQPWDGPPREFTAPAAVDCYMESAAGGLVKAGHRVSLLELLAGGKVEVVDGLVQLLVVPRARSAEFIAHWKKTMRPKP